MATESERQVQELLSEHFGFSPASFTRRAEDVANAVIYNVMEAVEKDMFARLGDSDDVKKALVSLETMLENGVDKQFDKFEAFCFRNVFTLKEELMAYMRLAHQPADGYDEALRGKDTELLSRWVKERDLADEAIVQAASARVAAARVDRRLRALEQLRDELDALTAGQSAEALAETFDSLVTGMPELQKQSAALLDRPALADRPALSNTGEPWRRREGYLQWAARKGVIERGRGLDRVEGEMAEAGAEEDAQSLHSMLPESKA